MAFPFFVLVQATVLIVLMIAGWLLSRNHQIGWRGLGWLLATWGVYSVEELARRGVNGAPGATQWPLWIAAAICIGCFVSSLLIDGRLHLATPSAHRSQN